MKFVLIITTAIFLSVLNSFGQNDTLVLKNKVTGKEKLVPEGQWIKVYCKNGSVFIGNLILKGFLQSGTDTTISISTPKENYTFINKVNTRDIVSIDIRRPIFLGGLLITGGFVSAVYMSKNIAFPYIIEYWANQGHYINKSLMIQGLLFTALIIVTTWKGFDFLYPKKYKTNEWNFIIKPPYNSGKKLY